MIREVVLFASDVGAAAMCRNQDGVVVRNPPKTLIPAADEALQLNGALVAHLQGRALEFEHVPPLSDSQWSDLLNQRFPGQTWRRWFGKTANTMYSVVVVEADETSVAALAAAVAASVPESTPASASAPDEGDGCAGLFRVVATMFLTAATVANALYARHMYGAASDDVDRYWGSVCADPTGHRGHRPLDGNWNSNRT